MFLSNIILKRTLLDGETIGLPMPAHECYGRIRNYLRTVHIPAHDTDEPMNSLVACVYNLARSEYVPTYSPDAPDATKLCLL